MDPRSDTWLAALDQITLDGAYMPQFALPPREGGCDINALLVNIQTDKQRARFTHGPLLCRLATPWQTTC